MLSRLMYNTCTGSDFHYFLFGLHMENNVKHPEDTVDSHVNPQRYHGALSSAVPQGTMLEMISDPDQPCGLFEEDDTEEG